MARLFINVTIDFFGIPVTLVTNVKIVPLLLWSREDTRSISLCGYFVSFYFITGNNF